MKKRRMEWIAAALVVVIMAAVLLFILISELRLNIQDANIELPSGMDIQNADSVQTNPKEPMDVGLPVSLTKDNVQATIQSLIRPEEYYIKLESYISHDQEFRTLVTEQWVLQGRCITRQKDSGRQQVLITDSENGRTLLRFEGDSRSVAVDSTFDGDVYANIPSYEHLLEIDPERILYADYTLLEEEPCIYVETYDYAMDYVERFYISIEKGLLIDCKTYTKGSLVYAMEMLSYSLDLSNVDKVIIPEADTEAET